MKQLFNIDNFLGRVQKGGGYVGAFFWFEELCSSDKDLKDTTSRKWVEKEYY
jgi:hypothetical protein